MGKYVDKDLEDQVAKVMNKVKKYQECVKNECEGKYAPRSGELYDCMDELCNHYLNASAGLPDF